jgi:hypothetical protein
MEKGILPRIWTSPYFTVTSVHLKSEASGKVHGGSRPVIPDKFLSAER